MNQPDSQVVRFKRLIHSWNTSRLVCCLSTWLIWTATLCNPLEIRNRKLWRCSEELFYSSVFKMTIIKVHKILKRSNLLLLFWSLIFLLVSDPVMTCSRIHFYFVGFTLVFTAFTCGTYFHCCLFSVLFYTIVTSYNLNTVILFKTVCMIVNRKRS